ncbi:TIM8 [Lepeophtheirus salmonis]|uniref:Mitochondrial import inner membrane translocase subunit n=1 Tax=Lepeophtheirus salmonis TaxID=72036 RepID=D3PHF0_LEPSM|nr:mitochondrial import inner membrane translocase subunit Tim8-like [Lepeophtheirus salmonis]ADD37986.1 Mitochondrial import inner membrane translocase subunit Tim8 [Lepeophtheirus salmonis]CAB4062523.1 TIM8 [Lepeophtheirus salmonis]CAF2904774.1 TIM8 [Lepeophtheirus salmonis]
MGLFGGSSGSDSKSSGDTLDLSDGWDSSDSKLSNSSFSGMEDFGDSSMDIQTFVQTEQQRQQIMEQVHKLNDVCWKMCVTSVSSSLGSRTESCLTNCTERFVDTTLLITQRFAQLASKMQGN